LVDSAHIVSRRRPLRARPGWTHGVSILTLAFALGGCNAASESVWPSLGGSSRPATTTRIEIPASAEEQRAAGATAPAAMTTAVGQRAAQLREDVVRLQDQVATQQQSLRQMRAGIAESAQRYQSLIAQINARLQVGTTPGNPVLTQQLGQAQGELDKFSANVGTLSQLATQVGGAASLGGFLLESLRGAYAVSGAVEEDHRLLAQAEDDVGRTMITIERMRIEVAEDMARQTASVSPLAPSRAPPHPAAPRPRQRRPGPWWSSVSTGPIRLSNSRSMPPPAGRSKSGRRSPSRSSGSPRPAATRAAVPRPPPPNRAARPSRSCVP
jgi:hypothetical protein